MDSVFLKIIVFQDNKEIEQMHKKLLEVVSIYLSASGMLPIHAQCIVVPSHTSELPSFYN